MQVISVLSVISVLVCQLRNLIHYLNACYAILYPEGIGIEIQTIDKTNKLLSVMTVRRDAVHNRAHNFCGISSFNGKKYFHALISNLRTTT